MSDIADTLVQTFTRLLSGAKFALLTRLVNRADNDKAPPGAGGALRGQIELGRTTVGVTGFPSRVRY